MRVTESHSLILICVALWEWVYWGVEADDGEVENKERWGEWERLKVRECGRKSVGVKRSCEGYRGGLWSGLSWKLGGASDVRFIVDDRSFSSLSTKWMALLHFGLSGLRFGGANHYLRYWSSIMTQQFALFVTFHHRWSQPIAVPYLLIWMWMSLSYNRIRIGGYLYMLHCLFWTMEMLLGHYGKYCICTVSFVQLFPF